MIRAPDTRLVSAVLAAVALLAACSGSEPDTTPTSTPTPTETAAPAETTPPAPTVVALTREQAADLYLEIITPTNDALESLDAVLLRFEEGDYTSERVVFEQIREAALAVEAVRVGEARLTGLQSAAIEGIDPTVWRDAVADLLRQFSGLSFWLDALTEVQTLEGVYDAADYVAGVQDQIAVVRAYLGLPTRTVQ